MTKKPIVISLEGDANADWIKLSRPGKAKEEIQLSGGKKLPAVLRPENAERIEEETGAKPGQSEG